MLERHIDHARGGTKSRVACFTEYLVRQNDLAQACKVRTTQTRIAVGAGASWYRKLADLSSRTLALEQNSSSPDHFRQVGNAATSPTGKISICRQPVIARADASHRLIYSIAQTCRRTRRRCRLVLRCFGPHQCDLVLTKLGTKIRCLTVSRDLDLLRGHAGIQQLSRSSFGTMA